MTISESSLGRKNSSGRASGNRASRFSPTNFKKLQKLDRQITALDKQLDQHKVFLIFGGENDIPKLTKKREKLDQKRKDLRSLRKGYVQNDKES
jgi:lysophospholipase L1-like esterase